MKTDEWNNLYPSQWKGLIVDEAIVHPAKFSSKLIKHIYDHLFEEGWLKEGDVVIDPFGGVALGALHAMRLGCAWRGVELEQKFCRLGQGMDCPGISKQYWRRYNGRGRKWNYLNICPDCGKLLDDPGRPVEFMTSYSRPIPERRPHHWMGNIETWQKLMLAGDARLLQGDSRKLLKVLGSEGNVSVSSPPFGAAMSGGGIAVKGYSNEEQRKESGEKPFDLVGKRSYMPENQGTSNGNLAAMPSSDASFQASISSPPFRQSEGGTPEPKEGGVIDKALYERHKAGNAAAQGYGETDANLGNMRANDDSFIAAVSSPPFEDNTATSNRPNKLNPEYIEKYGQKQLYGDYGQSEGQLGETSGDDFWLAARTIVEQVYQALAPGGHAVWVVKDFVKNKERVPFCDQWRQLCEAVGFVTLHEHHAMLVHRKGTQKAMFGDDVEIKTESKSFFRRLAEKNGSPRIDWEVVWCMEKPK